MDATMAKKPKNKERKDPTGVRTVAFRASIGYVEWLERVAKHDRATVAGFIDRALSDRARAIGFTENPPERIP